MEGIISKTVLIVVAIALVVAIGNSKLGNTSKEGADGAMGQYVGTMKVNYHNDSSAWSQTVNLTQQGQ